MLSIKPAHPQKCTPHLLPARIKHDGLVNNAEQYWQPQSDDFGKQHAYFRGRHLRGTVLPLPAHYTGAVLHMTDMRLPQQHTQGDNVPVEVEAEDDQHEDDEDVKIAEQVAEFEEMVVWGHGAEIDEGQDAFAKAMHEWVGFAESMHVEADETQSKGVEGVLVVTPQNAA